MKRLLLFFTTFSCIATVQMKISSHKKKQVPILMGIIDTKSDDSMQELLEVIKHDFSFTNQFQVTTQLFSKIPTKKEVKELGKDVLFALFITPHSRNFEWRLYDALNGSMVTGKKYRKRGYELRGWAHNISDMVWVALTGDEGFFSTKIAYCKKVLQNNKEIKHVYIADYDGSNAQLLVDTPTINVAPRWNNDHKKPMVFYSDFTNTNVRLMVSDLEKKRSVASDFDGVNMIPAFSRDGKKIVYCISRGDGSCQLYYYRRGLFKKITNNEGNNVSPSLSQDGKTIYFCSDFETGKPQIYAFNMPTHNLERLTDGGYCASPRYSAKAEKLAYSRIVSGTMQLFVYDIKSKIHTQLTFDKGNKEECAWSPCGTKMLYSVEEMGKKSRIAMMSILSNERHFLTDLQQDCSFPDWSPVYEQYPVVCV